MLKELIVAKEYLKKNGYSVFFGQKEGFETLLFFKSPLNTAILGLTYNSKHSDDCIDIGNLETDRYNNKPVLKLCSAIMSNNFSIETLQKSIQYIL